MDLSSMGRGYGANSDHKAPVLESKYTYRITRGGETTRQEVNRVPRFTRMKMENLNSKVLRETAARSVMIEQARSRHSLRVVIKEAA